MVFIFFIFIFAIQVVAGGGAVEAALSGYLECLATTLGSREQLAIAEFAESLLIIPKVCYNLWVHDISPHPHWYYWGDNNMCLFQVLAVNAAKDATDLVAKLRAYHTIAQTQADKKHLSRYLFWSSCEWHSGLKQWAIYCSLSFSAISVTWN